MQTLHYVAKPSPTSTTSPPWPAVLVLHDVLGVSDDMREQCDWLAAAGFLTVMPDLYRGRGAIACVRGLIAQVAAQQGPVFEQLDAVRRQLQARSDCTGRVGVIGYCLGGDFALLLAGRGEYSAAAINYGNLPKNAGEVLGGSCPVVASYGRKDRRLRGAADRIAAELTKRNVPFDVKEYSEAGHAFINRPNLPTSVLTLARVLGIGSYHHASAADAKQRILTFFDQHLRQEPH